MAKKFGKHEDYLKKKAIKEFSTESIDTQLRKCKNVCDLILTKVIFSNWLN